MIPRDVSLRIDQRHRRASRGGMCRAAATIAANVAACVECRWPTLFQSRWRTCH